MIVVNCRFFSQKITGVQRFGRELVKNLPSEINGQKVILIAPKNLEGNSELKSYPNAFFFGYNKGHLWEQIDLPIYLLKNKNPLLINFTSIAPVFYTNKIITIHDLAFYHHPEWFSYTFQKLYNTLLPISAKNCKKIITVSHYVKNDITSQFNILPEKVSVVYPGVSSFFSPDENVLKNKTILSVSSMDPRKNIAHLVQAFQELNLPDYQLQLVGGSSTHFKNGSESNFMGTNVKMLGYVNDTELKKLYQSAKLFVYPSLFEGFGIPPLEAQACGTVVAVSNKTSLPEVYGESAEYFNPISVESIKNSILNILSNSTLQNEMIERGIENVKKYTWQNAIEQLIGVISKLQYEKSIST